MANNLANSYIATGAAVGFNRGMSPERQAERANAYAQKEASDQDLRNIRATEPTDQDRQNMADTQSLELQNSLETQKELLRDNNRKSTFSAYTRYDADGEVRHINTMITDLAGNGSKLFGQIARVDKLTENDRQMMEDLGIPPDMVTRIITEPELNKSYVKYTKKDGTVEFGDLDALKGMTGYNDYADARELGRQKIARETEMMSALGYDLTPNGREAFRRTRAELGPDADPKSPEFQEAYTKHFDAVRKTMRVGRYGGGGKENLTEREAQADRMTRMQAQEEGFVEGSTEWTRAFAENMSSVNTEFSRPSAIRKIEGAEDAVANLEAKDFWNTDFDTLNPSERGQWESEIRRLEKLGGAELSQTDRTSLDRIQRLTSLGSSASELTDEQTGIMDSLLRTAKRYVFNEVEGVKAEASFSAYRNLVQHALYGAALTPNEAKTFRKQLGGLGQKTGPVLAQLRVTMEEIKDTYQAIQRTNDPMVLAWRTGKTGSELQDVIDGLDDRIEMIDNMANDRPITTVNPPIQEQQGDVVITDEARAIMDRLRGGQQ